MRIGRLARIGMFCIAGISAYCHQIVAAQAYKVGEWDVVQTPRSGPKTGCMMTGLYQDGTTLGVIMNRRYEWGLGFLNPKWNLDPSGRTPVSVVIDGVVVAKGAATHGGQDLAYLPLVGPEPFKALRAGRTLDVLTPAGKLNFLLDGTARAMSAVLDCVKQLNGEATPVASTPRTDFQLVSQAEAAVMATNMLNAAGASGYRLQPPSPGGTGVGFILSDGTEGYLMAARGNTKSADDFGTWLLSELSKSCKGDFVSGRQSIPSTDGSVVRKIGSECRVGGSAKVTEVTVIRRANGMLLSVSHELPTTPVLAADGAKKQRDAVVEAAMQLP